MTTINTFIPNETGYAPWSKPVSTFRTPFKIIVHAVTDGVPGTFDDPKDLANWILENPYVRAVEIIET